MATFNNKELTFILNPHETNQQPKTAARLQRAQFGKRGMSATAAVRLPPSVAFPILFSSAAAALAYISSIECDFVFDDHLAIVNNPDVSPEAPFSNLLANDFWGKALEKEDSHKSYRPLTVLSFRVHTWWTGQPAAPRYFHAVNVVLHAIVTACVAALGAWLWPRRRCGGRPRVALLAGTLFAVHPVHVEAVTGVVGRAELLCALCCFASAAAYSGSASWPHRGIIARCGLGVAAAVLFGMGVLCKETGVTLLGILGATEIVVHLPRSLGAPQAPRGILPVLRKNLFGSIVRCALLGACAVAYALMRLLLMRPAGGRLSFSSASLSTSDLIRRAENPLAFVAGRTRWLLSVGRVNCEYVRLLVWPRTLCIEYSFDCVPLALEPTLAVAANLPPLILLLASLALVTAALRNAYRRAHGRHTLVAAAWLVMPWLPISHLPLRLGTLVAERTLYLPSVGAVLLAANVAANALQPSSQRHAVAANAVQPSSQRQAASGVGSICARLAGALPVGLVVGLLAARTLVRTLDWRSDDSAFESGVIACPRSAKLHQNMCVLRTGQRRLDDADHHCALAEQIDPQYCDTAKSRAFLHLARDDIGRAVGAFNESLTCIYTNLHSYRVLLSLYDLQVQSRRTSPFHDLP